MLTCFLPPKTALRAGSALIIVLFLENAWRHFQILAVAALRVP
jgi:hypothetical protein